EHTAQRPAFTCGNGRARTRPRHPSWWRAAWSHNAGPRAANRPPDCILRLSLNFSQLNRKRLSLHGITLLSRKKSCQEGEQPYDNRVYPVCLRISSPKTTPDSGPVRWRSHHQRWRWSAAAGGRETHRDPEPVCCLFHRLSESRSDRTSGGGDGGAEGLWSGPGIRRSERSRGVAERSLVGGVGGEGGSRPSSLSRKEHPESAGIDPSDGQWEGALQKDRAGSRSRGPAAGGYFPRS